MPDSSRWLRLYQQHAGKKFWEVRAQADDPAVGELLIYGPIFSEQIFPEDVSPKQIAEDLAALGGIKQLHVYINSPGGSAFAGLTINNILRRQQAEVIVHVDGLAASAASIVAMAGDRIIMPANSLMMIHDPWTIALGNATELRQVADDLDRLKGAIVASYMQHAKVSAVEIAAMMAAETWLTPEEALEIGLATEIEASKAVAASLRGGVLVVNGREWPADLFQSRPPVPSENDGVVAASGPEVTVGQLAHAMAKALGLRLKPDEATEESQNHDRERLRVQLEALKLKEVSE